MPARSPEALEKQRARRRAYEKRRRAEGHTRYKKDPEKLLISKSKFDKIDYYNDPKREPWTDFDDECFWLDPIALNSIVGIQRKYGEIK